MLKIPVTAGAIFGCLIALFLMARFGIPFDPHEKGKRIAILVFAMLLLSWIFLMETGYL